MLKGLAGIYVAGYPVQWRKVYPVGRLVCLPNYSWQRERYWLDFESYKDEDYRWQALYERQHHQHHPFAGIYMKSAEPATDQIWQMELTLNRFGYLSDHKIDSTTVLPATAYIEIVLAAAYEIFGAVPQVLMDIEFRRAMVLPSNSACVIQVIFTQKSSGNNAFRIFSRLRDAHRNVGDWTLHTTGIVVLEQKNFAKPLLAREVIEKLSADYQIEISKQDYYFKLAEYGFKYGPSFQSIDKLWRKDGIALGYLQPVPELQAEINRYYLHPALFDACLQVGLSQFIEEPSTSIEVTTERVFMPTHIAQLRIYSRITLPLWSQASDTAKTDQSKGVFEGDVRLITETGEIVAEVIGARVQQLVFGPDYDATENLENWLYEIEWQPSYNLKKEQSIEYVATGRWLIFADSSGIGRQLCELLRLQGEECLLIYQNNYQEWLRLFEKDESPSCRGVIHLCSIDVVTTAATTTDLLASANALVCGSVLQLIKELTAIRWQQVPRLWLVTQGALPVTQTHSDLTILQSPLWGFGRTIAQEQPEFWGGLIDLDPDATVTDSAAQLFAEIWNPDGEDQFALRGKERFVARLVHKERRLKQKPYRFHADGAYLITGGLGDLGLLIAHWMVEQGARRLILIGRTQLPIRAQWQQLETGSLLAKKIAAIKALEALGASVQVVSLDVSNEEQLTAFVQAYRVEGWPQIRGVIHAAGEAKDDTLLQLNIASLQEILQPKVIGGLLLHHLFKDTQLDFFVLFSSASALLNSPRLGAYAAANAFLDALAHYRKAVGLPALSINWGAWLGLGVAKQYDSSRHASLRGMRAIPPAEGLEIFAQLLSEDLTQVAVINANWQEWQQFYPLAAQSPLLSKLFNQPLEHDDNQANERDQFIAAAPTQRWQLLLDYIREQIAKVLRLPSEKLDDEQSLYNLGFDSLLAVELKNRLELRLGIALPMIAFLQGPSIKQLTGQVLDLLMSSLSKSVIALTQGEQQCHEHKLSYGQQAIWFLQQLAPQSAAYNIILALRVRAGLNVEALQNAFRAFIHRHPCLRTIYVLRDDKPVQIVQEDFQFNIDCIDASVWSWEELNASLIKVAHRPFDLEKGPILRLSVYTRSINDQILLLVVHHIAFDFWSVVILTDELSQLYQAELSHREAQLPSLTNQYTDYVRWQSEMLAAAEGERHWQYWRESLAGELTVLNLPTDRPRPPIQTYSGQSWPFVINRETTEWLKAFANAQEVTLYTVLLTAFQILLYRYTSQQDILIGSPFAGRSRAEFEGIVGFFANLIPLRARLSNNLMVKSLLLQVRATVLGALEHQDFPSHLLVERLHPLRDASHSSLFQTVFILQKPHKLNAEGLAPFILGERGASMNLGGLQLESFTLEQQVVAYDVMLTMVESHGELAASWQYNTDLFDSVTMARMAGHFQVLLENIATSPAQPLANLMILTTAERQQLLQKWAQKEVYPIDEKCLHEIFTERAEHTPYAVALSCADITLSYQELNCRANQLANYLIYIGVGVETHVGICLERSVELMIALLGVLKAGGVYVPIDPNYPKERKSFILADGQLKVLLTRQRLLTDLPNQAAHIICFDLEWEKISCQSDVTPINQASPENLAYIIYTSGSTGKPKGVSVSHRAVLNHNLAMAKKINLTAVDRVWQFHSISFDAAVEEIFPTWLAGATLVVRWEDILLTGTEFLRFADRADLTIVNFPTVYWHELVNELSLLKESLPSSLRVVIVGGEKASLECLQTWRRLNGAERIRWINTYGPTEATVTTTTYEPDWDSASLSILPIGQPIGNVETYLLDRELEPVPIGIAGELHIGGIGLARGYWQRAELTAEKFIPHPYSKQEGDRLYRSGDMARYLADGNIEFIGRIDE
ncbi:MAG: amino acid adenylation domain-containing protein, partial [Acidobacteriota bacterium]